jgi:uncharacterized protein (DUF1810 family)
MSEQRTQAHRFELERFVRAQEPLIEQVREELAAGRKRTHWMWFIFPQLRGLGRSVTAQHYAISSLAEARAYLQHPLLGRRLVECTELVNAVENRTAHEIFGSPDDLKFRSCLSLFRHVLNAPVVFQTALNRYFNGAADPDTLALLQQIGHAGPTGQSSDQ